MELWAIFILREACPFKNWLIVIVKGTSIMNFGKNPQHDFPKMRGGGSTAVWNFSENSSVLEGTGFPKCQTNPIIDNIWCQPPSYKLGFNTNWKNWRRKNPNFSKKASDDCSFARGVPFCCDPMEWRQERGRKKEMKDETTSRILCNQSWMTPCNPCFKLKELQAGRWC